MVKPTS